MRLETKAALICAAAGIALYLTDLLIASMITISSLAAYLVLSSIRNSSKPDSFSDYLKSLDDDQKRS